MARITVLLIIICFNFWYNFANADPSLRVNTTSGWVEGKKRPLGGGGNCDSFQGIPYAEPPVGPLRFMDPRPPKAWSGVRNATSHGAICMQYSGTTQSIHPNSNEDCLFLNVYSKDITAKPLKPVMVWIHGGAFKDGSGNDDLYGPDFLVPNGVVLVTLNYRLEALGLLCLDTKEVPGNAGMKDQVLALRWVRDNIEQFGGDPNKVTIFGGSAGAASVGFHLVSPMSEGLFKRAILHGGSFNCDWATDKYGRERSEALAHKVGCYMNDTQELLKCLQNTSLEKFVNLYIPVTSAEYLDTFINIKFGIVKEKPFNTEAFFNKDIKESLESTSNVEIMAGYTSEEGIAFIRDLNHQVYVLNTFPEMMIKEDYVRNCPVDVQKEIAKKIRDYHFPGGLVTNDTRAQLVEFYSYFVIKYAMEEFFNARAKMINYKPVYRFRYSFDSDVPYYNPYGLVGVNHGEDIFNIFYSPMVFPFQSSGFPTILSYITFWTNFAIHGNPTPPNNTMGITWPPFDNANRYYLDIGTENKVLQNPEKEDLTFWKNIYSSYKYKCRSNIWL